MNFLRFLQSTPSELLGGRYKLIGQLGAGGFGETFLAEDCHLPGHPRCVIKKLKPQVSSTAGLRTAKRLFDTEANVLYLLGEHDQIPRLLAHFEHNEEFYLAQELIEGEPLNQELVNNRQWTEEQVVSLLDDILHVLTFVHEQGVIHRDIKPQNLIRRQHDSRIVLIDFGAVKQASVQLADPNSGPTRTISIGTQGYMPNEQIAGNPRFSSDLYAIGKIGIQALTGISPRHLAEDPQTGEVMWRHLAPQASVELVEFLEKMVRYDFRSRYATATEALTALKQLPIQPIARTATTPQPPIAPKVNQPNISPPPVVGQPSVSQPIEATAAFSQIASTPATEVNSTALWTGQSGSSPPESSPNSSASPHSAPSPTIATSIEASGASSVNSNRIPPASPTSATSRLATQPIGNPAPRPHPPSSSRINPNRLGRSALSSLALPAAGIIAIGLLIALFRPSATEPPALDPEVTDPEVIAPSPSEPQAPSASPSPDVNAQLTALLTEANQLREAKQFPQAIEQYDRVIALDANSSEAHWGKCYSLNRLLRPGEATIACDAALAINPNYAEALWSKGYALDLQQNPTEALTFYDRAIALKPDFAEAWSNKGTALFFLGRPEESLTALNKATELDPNLAEAWNNRGAVLWSLRRFDEAVNSVDRALQLQPDYQDALSLREQMRRMGR
ncbi:serine/threonine protein kinase [filamentous cyanobacterium CCP2]|nr:serine/threonine protein kinase [filamentous cyanobacterium CCP2]